ncbi:speedy protein 1-A-like [Bufo bufo]|uniref:speedy protein 1-A-like n=1 Tax=Bufo bufo TaxID=8384 RepID=UPI001ABEB4A1|nr:speedy protein 1-A-like [Bufo bufo]
MSYFPQMQQGYNVPAIVINRFVQLKLVRRQRAESLLLDAVRGGVKLCPASVGDRKISMEEDVENFPRRTGEATTRKRKTELSPEESRKRKKMDDDIPQPEERAAFFTLLEDEHIQSFLARDSCLKISDKYLLAMVLTYFRRANLRTEEYRTYFFPSLFLANQFEEDELFRQEIYPWALGLMWMIQRKQLHHLRNQILIRMGFRAWVDRETCDLIMAQDPDHCAWKRERKVHHSWAIRQCRRDDVDFTITGTWITPAPCSLCNTILHPCQEE